MPPGCYWVIAGNVSSGSNFIHLNYTTHVGIVQVGCDQDVCVKLYNPSVRLCWNWFLAGLQIIAARGDDPAINREAVAEFERNVEETFMANVAMRPAEKQIAGMFADWARLAGEGDPDLADLK